MKRILILMALALTVVGPVFAQEEPRLDEKVDVSLVQLDVTVTDKTGNQILGLNKDDFIVWEEGEPVTLDSLDYFTNRRLLDTPEDQAAFKVVRVNEERYFVIMFHTLPDPTFRRNFYHDVQQARRAAIDFVKNRMRDEDKVAIVGYDFRLKIFADFSSDRFLLSDAIEEAVSFSNGISEKPAEPVENGIFATIDVKEMINKTGRVYDGLRILADSLDPIAARKVLMLFSPGIGEPGSFSNQIARNDETWFRPMLESLQRANVTVYPMHLLRDASIHAAEQNLVRLATETGGEYYRQAISFELPLKMVENENNGYYMLSYYGPPAEDKLFDISVKLKNPEFVVKSRTGR